MTVQQVKNLVKTGEWTIARAEKELYRIVRVGTYDRISLEETRDGRLAVYVLTSNPHKDF